MRPVQTLCGVSSGGKMYDGGHKPEVYTEKLIYKLLDMIATKFQRLPLRFRGPASQWASANLESLKNELNDHLIILWHWLPNVASKKSMTNINIFSN